MHKWGTFCVCVVATTVGRALREHISWLHLKVDQLSDMIRSTTKQLLVNPSTANSAKAISLLGRLHIPYELHAPFPDCCFITLPYRKLSGCKGGLNNVTYTILHA